jgi:hypothetical protein
MDFPPSRGGGTKYGYIKVIKGRVLRDGLEAIPEGEKCVILTKAGASVTKGRG